MCESQQYATSQLHSLKAEVNRLNKLNLKLQKRLEQSCKVMKNQKRQLDDVRRYTWGMQDKARQELAKLEEDHQARGKYAYLKGLWTGRAEVAGKVFGMLFVDFATSLIDKLREIGACS